MEPKIDAELIKVIKDAIATSSCCTEALDKVIKFEKEQRELKGWHVSAPLDVMCGQRVIEDPMDEAQKMAHDILQIKLELAQGKCREVDVTKEEIL